MLVISHALRQQPAMRLLVDLLRREFRRPSRQREWQKKSAPFVHEARDGLRFRLFPPEYIDSQIFIEGIYELHLLRFLRKRERGGVMLDVGANIGNHALYLAPNFDEIHCFEPNPVALERLRENVALNRSTLHIHPVGLGAADAELEFHANTSGNLGGSSFARTDFPVSSILPVRRGDAYLASHGIEGIDLIKIDVEGFEAEVLAGLVETIKRERPVIIFEYDGRTNAEAEFDRFIAALPGYRFAEFTAAPGKGFGRWWGILRRGGEATIVPMERPAARYYEAIFALPN